MLEHLKCNFGTDEDETNRRNSAIMQINHSIRDLSRILYLSNFKSTCIIPGLRCLTEEFKKMTTAKATGTSLNKRFNEQNNSCPRAS